MTHFIQCAIAAEEGRRGVIVIIEKDELACRDFYECWQIMVDNQYTVGDCQILREGLQRIQAAFRDENGEEGDEKPRPETVLVKIADSTAKLASKAVDVRIDR